MTWFLLINVNEILWNVELDYYLLGWKNGSFSVGTSSTWSTVSRSTSISAGLALETMGSKLNSLNISFDFIHFSTSQLKACKTKIIYIIHVIDKVINTYKIKTSEWQRGNNEERW